MAEKLDKLVLDTANVIRWEIQRLDCDDLDVSVDDLLPCGWVRLGDEDPIVCGPAELICLRLERILTFSANNRDRYICESLLRRVPGAIAGPPERTRDWPVDKIKVAPYNGRVWGTEEKGYVSVGWIDTNVGRKWFAGHNSRVVDLLAVSFVERRFYNSRNMALRMAGAVAHMSALETLAEGV